MDNNLINNKENLNNPCNKIATLEIVDHPPASLLSQCIPEGVAKYNISKFILLATASLCIALGTHLAANESNKMIFAACLSALGNFAWGYCTTGQHVAKDKRDYDKSVSE